MKRQIENKYVTGTNFNREAAKGNHQLPLSLCFSWDICGSDFHFHEYLKTFVLFARHVHIKCSDPYNQLYVFSEQGKKCISLKSRQHICPNRPTAECVKKASCQTSNQVLGRPRRHLHSSCTWNSWKMQK